MIELKYAVRIRDVEVTDRIDRKPLRFAQHARAPAPPFGALRCRGEAVLTDHQIGDRIAGSRFTAVRIKRRIVFQNPSVRHVRDKQVPPGLRASPPVHPSGMHRLDAVVGCCGFVVHVTKRVKLLF